MGGEYGMGNRAKEPISEGVDQLFRRQALCLQELDEIPKRPVRAPVRSPGDTEPKAGVVSRLANAAVVLATRLGTNRSPVIGSAAHPSRSKEPNCCMRALNWSTDFQPCWTSPIRRSKV